MRGGDGVRKKDGKWRVRWTDSHGQRREAVVEARSRTEAREKRAQLVTKAREQRLGIWDGDSDATFADVWKLYRPIAKAKGNWRTIEIYWRRHIEPEFGSKRIRQVSKNDVRRWLADKSREGLEPQTCEHLRIRLGALFNFAADEGIYRGENVASAIGPLDVPEGEVRHLEWEFVQGVIDAVPDAWRSFFALAVYTGLRAGELRALRHESVSPDWRFLAVTRSGTRRSTKTSRNRMVPLPRAALPYLEAALEASKGRAWLFTDEAGRQLSRHVKLPLILREALDRLGLVDSYTGWCHRGCKVRETNLRTRAEWRCPKCSRPGKVEPQHPLVFHDLRKTWETHLHEVVGDPMAVFRLAGHSPEVAMRRYVAHNQKHLAAKADALDFKKPAPSSPRTTTESTENGTEHTSTEDPQAPATTTE